jgi:enoyl-CoA hydratase/carnithine racemase
MSDPVISLERFPDEQIAVLTLDRPPLNAIDGQMVAELAEATAELTADAEIRAVVVRSALEGVFMAGADIHEFERIAEEGIDRACWRRRSSAASPRFRSRRSPRSAGMRSAAGSSSPRV